MEARWTVIDEGLGWGKGSVDSDEGAAPAGWTRRNLAVNRVRRKRRAFMGTAVGRGWNRRWEMGQGESSGAAC